MCFERSFPHRRHALSGLLKPSHFFLTFSVLEEEGRKWVRDLKGGERPVGNEMGAQRLGEEQYCHAFREESTWP